MLNQTKMKEYQKSGLSEVITEANPHRLIQMLLEAAIEKLLIAKGCMERNEFEGKGLHISWTIDIINGLSISIDKENGGDIAEKLSDLYDYIKKQLLLANVENNIDKIVGAIDLLREIKVGWDAIASDVTQQEASSDS